MRGTTSLSYWTWIGWQSNIARFSAPISHSRRNSSFTTHCNTKSILLPHPLEKVILCLPYLEIIIISRRFLLLDYESIRKLIGFLLRFEEFNSVVVRCARKMDPIVWEPLFVIAGNCKKMFVQCLSSGQLHTAASYLQIIRYTKGLV